MKEVLEIIAKALVDNPDQVKITEIVNEDSTYTLQLNVAEGDMGKVIGKQGRIAKGSGTRVQDVNQLLKQFGEMHKMIKQFSGGKQQRMLTRLRRGK